MPGSVVQFKQVAQNTALSPASVTLDAPATAGNTLVVVYGGDDYVTLANRPSGFTEPTGGRQETFLGHYVWYKTAVGGETTFTATPGSAVPWAMIALELSGVGALNVSNGTLIASGANTMTTPSVVATAGNRYAVASIGGSLSSAFNTGMGAWTGSYVEAADVATTLASGTRDNIAVATLNYTSDGVTGTSTTATWDAAISPQSRTGIILVFNEATAAADPGTVWAPHLLEPPGRISPGGFWVPWSGDPSPDAAASTSPAAVEATGTGSAPDASAALAPNATEATGTGTADTAAAALGVNAVEATGTGAAPDATVSTATSTSPTATEAAGTGTAPDAVVALGVNAAQPTAAGSALDAVAAIAPNATEATGAGTAEWDAGSAISLDLSADNPVDAVGTAFDATVSTASQTSANATEAAATGSALDATTAASVNAAAATATAVANDATVSTSSSVSAAAVEATGTGTAADPSTAVTVNAGQPTAAGQALDATVSTTAATSANAGVATGTGVAFDPVAAMQVLAAAAAVVGAAYDTTVIIGGPGSAFAGVASGTGQAFDTRVRKRIPRPSTGTTARPSTGITPRPFTTVTQRP